MDSLKGDEIEINYYIPSLKMITSEHILFLLISYLTGSFPSAVWVGKIFYNKDVREYGSGNLDNKYI